MRNKIESSEVVDARKQSMGAKEALELAESVNEIYSARGKNVTHIKLEDGPSEQELRDALIGPTGNLRAPSIKIGDKLLVGFNEELYSQVVKTTTKAR